MYKVVYLVYGMGEDSPGGGCANGIGRALYYWREGDNQGAREGGNAMGWVLVVYVGREYVAHEEFATLRAAQERAVELKRDGYTLYIAQCAR